MLAKTRLEYVDVIISTVSKVKLQSTRQYRLVRTVVTGLSRKLTGHLRVT